MVTKLDKEGCSYGMINRIKIEETQKSINDINCKLDRLDIKMTELFNHQSSRWPPQAVWAMGILTAIATAITTSAVGRFF